MAVVEEPVVDSTVKEVAVAAPQVPAPGVDDKTVTTPLSEAVSVKAEDLKGSESGKEKKGNEKDEEGSKDKPKRVRSPTFLVRYLKNAEQRRGSVVEQGVGGRVKWYNLWSRYGFITRSDCDDNTEKPKDVFVHQSAIAKSRFMMPYLRTLCINEPVVFDIVEGKNGPEAANVTGPDGRQVKGVPYRLFSTYSSSRGKRRTIEEGKEEEEVKDAKTEAKEVNGEEKKKGRAIRRRQQRHKAGVNAAEKQTEGDAKEDVQKRNRPGQRRAVRVTEEKNGEEEKKQNGGHRNRRKRSDKKSRKEVKGNDGTEKADQTATAETAEQQCHDVVTVLQEVAKDSKGVVEEVVLDVEANVLSPNAAVDLLLKHVVDSIAEVQLAEEGGVDSAMEKIVVESIEE